MAHLVLTGLTKRYGSVTAVERLDLEVAQGEFVSLLGPSGCGKTTTLQMVAGFVEPSSGAARLNGADLLRMKPNKRGLGIVFQSYALFPHATAAENIAFGLEMRGIAKPERDQRVREIIALVGLTGLEDRHPRRMSGGQQQRVALARALVIKPSLLLLDEPLSNLDAKLRDEMQAELRGIQRSLGTTTILVTHDQSEAMALSDRIVVMNKGRVEQIATPEEAYGRPASPFVATFLGKTNSFRAAAVDGSDGRQVRIGDAILALAVPASTTMVTVTVRPERIVFAEAGVPARVRARVFQGAHWLFHLECDGGTVSVIRQNDGAPQPMEGESVRLDWAPDDMFVQAEVGAL